MYKVDIPLDSKESAAISRRQNAEAARKSRIFDSKQRTIGVDLVALDAQVKQRKEQMNDEKLRHDAYSSLMIRNDQTAQLLDANTNRARNQIAKELCDFRQREQTYESRREFDLNDPNYIKKGVCLGQNEHGISSLQSFVGEDANYIDRKKGQQEQIREWSIALQQERQHAENDVNLQDRMYDLKRIQLDNKACDLDAQQKEEVANNIRNLKDFNKRLAEEQRLEREHHKNEEQAQNAIEIRNQVLGDTLTENPNVSRSAFGPHRVIPDRWKGMSEDELLKIRQEQEAKRLENRKMREAEQENNNEWSLQKNAQAKAGILLDRERQRQTKELRKQLDAENSFIAAEQKKMKQELDHIVYTNVPGDAYYSQFNTSTR